MPDQDEFALLKQSVEDLAHRVALLESQRSIPLAPHVPIAGRDGPLALKTINRIGAFTLALGVIFFFKYTVDENLIGAASGVVLGVFFGLALIASGEWLIRKDQRIFAQGVSGCGLAVIYVSIYASFAFYKVLAESAGFLLLAAVSAGAVGLSIRYKNPAIAALGLVGALLTPILLRAPSADVTIGFAFFLLVEVTAFTIAIWQNWAILVPIVVPLSLFAAAFLFEPKHATRFAVFSLLLSLAHFAATAFERGSAAVKNGLYAVGHSCLLVAMLRYLSLSIAEGSVVRELDSVLLAVYGIALLAYGLVRTSSMDRTLGLVLIGIVIAKLYLVDVWVLARVYRIIAFVGLGALLLAASYIYSQSDRRRRS